MRAARRAHPFFAHASESDIVSTDQREREVDAMPRLAVVEEDVGSSVAPYGCREEVPANDGASIASVPFQL